MTFDEWWKGSGQMRGEAIFRHCWDNAIESAAKECDELGEMLGSPARHCAGEVRKLRTK